MTACIVVKPAVINAAPVVIITIYSITMKIDWVKEFPWSDHVIITMPVIAIMMVRCITKAHICFIRIAAAITMTRAGEHGKHG